MPPFLCLTVPPTVHERRQACGFRDNYEKFVAAGYTILGCSGDGAELQSSWKEKQSYQFDFVCDEGLAFSTSVGMKMDGREMSARSAQDIRASQARDNQAPAALILRRRPTLAEAALWLLCAGATSSWGRTAWSGRRRRSRRTSP